LKNTQRIIFGFSICLFSAAIVTIGKCAAEKPIGSAETAPERALKPAFVLRTFSFPDKFSLGKLYAYNLPKPNAILLNGFSVARGGGRFLAEAKGQFRTRLRSSEVVYLLPSYELLAHTEALKNVDPNCIDCLTFTGSSLMLPVEKTLPAFARLTGIRRLEIEASEIKDQDLLPIKNLTNLEALSLVGNGLNGSCFKEFGKLTKMRDLNVNFNPFDKSTFAYISHFDNLEILKISQCRIDDDGVREISRLPKLIQLEIGQSAITARALTYVRTMKSLKRLDLTGSSLKPKDLRVLKGMKLKCINLPERRYLALDMKMLKELFPDTKLGMTGQAQPVDNETQAIFAPLK